MSERIEGQDSNKNSYPYTISCEARKTGREKGVTQSPTVNYKNEATKILMVNYQKGKGDKFIVSPPKTIERRRREKSDDEREDNKERKHSKVSDKRPKQVVKIIINKQKKISEEFSGKAEQLEAFISALEIRYDRMKPEYKGKEVKLERDIMEIAEESMKGEAIRWWGSTKAELKEAVTLKRFTTILTERWGVRLSSTDVIQELGKEKNRQKEGESLSSFGDRLRTLAAKGGIKDSNTTLLYAFINLLDEEENGKIKDSLGTWLNKQGTDKTSFASLVSKANDLALHKFKGGKEKKKEEKKKGDVGAITTPPAKQEAQESIKRCKFHENATNHTTEECRIFINLLNERKESQPPQGQGWRGRGRGRGDNRGQARGRGGGGYRGRQQPYNPAGAYGGMPQWQTYPPPPIPPGMPTIPGGGQLPPATQGGEGFVPPQGNTFDSRACFQCGQVGHMARDCQSIQFQKAMMLALSNQQSQQNKPATSNYQGKEVEREAKATTVQLRGRKRVRKEDSDSGKKRKAKRRKRCKDMKEEREKWKNQAKEEENNEIGQEKSEKREKTRSNLEKDVKKEGDNHKIPGKTYPKRKFMPIHENEMDHLMAINDDKSKRRKYTATFTTVNVYGKPIRTLADSGASHSVISLAWLRYIGGEKLIKDSAVVLMDAQGEEIKVNGEVTLPVQFGKGLFEWKFCVAEELFCPLILGVDVMNKGSINFQKKRLKINGEYMPITFTLNEIQQYTVVAAINKKVPAHELVKIKGRVIRDEDCSSLVEPQTYVVNTGGMLVDSLVVESKIKQHNKKSGETENQEVITMLAMNVTNKSKQVKKGDILATLSVLKEQECEVMYTNLRKPSTTSITNTPLIESLYEGGIASIVAIRSRQDEKNEVNREVPLSEDCHFLQQPELKGGLREPDEVFLTDGNSVVHNEEVISNIVEGMTRSHVECPTRIKGFKVPLVIRQAGCDEVSMRQSESKDGPSRQPESKGGPTLANESELVQKDLESDRMMQNLAIGTGEGVPDQDTEATGLKEDTQSCVLASPEVGRLEQVVNDPEGTSTCSAISQEELEDIEFINSQDMLSVGSQYLKKHLVEERERDKKDVFKGPTEGVIPLMVEECECTIEEKAEIKNLLTKYKEILVTSLTPEFTGGNAYFQPHEINLEHDNPIWTSQFPLGHKEKEVLEEMAQEQYKAGVIEPSTTTKYNSPVLVVPKKGSTFSTATAAWRPVIDFRNINKATVKENWPIPRTEEAIDALREAKYITTLDATSGYWQMPLSEESKAKTAFQTLTQRWQYKCLPMGITNAAPTFQKNMEIMLGGLLWKCCVVYIDDIIVYSATFQEHILHLEEVFKRLKMCNVVIKPAKCKIARREATYLGHVVGNGRVQPDPDNIKAIKECPLPTTLQEIRSFTMLASYYRKFVHNFASIAKPLTDYMKRKGKKVKVDLTEEAKEAVESLKRILTSNLPLR